MTYWLEQADVEGRVFAGERVKSHAKGAKAGCSHSPAFRVLARLHHLSGSRPRLRSGMVLLVDDQERGGTLPVTSLRTGAAGRRCRRRNLDKSATVGPLRAT